MRSSKWQKAAQQHRHADTLAWLSALQSQSTPQEAPQWPNFESFALACKTRQRGGIRGLELYPWQKDFAEILERRSVVVAKSRQTGCSQIVILWALYQAISRDGFLGLIVSKSFGDAQLLARRVRRSVTGLGIEPVNDSLALMAFANDSMLIFRSIEPTENVGRGIDNLDFLLLDEASFYSDLGGALTSLGPALSASANPRMCLVSTPNGRVGTYWDRLCNGIGENALETHLNSCRNGESAYKAIEPDNGIAKFIVHWRSIPAYRNEPDFLGRIQKEFGLTDADVKQEYDLNFEQSSQNVFDFALVKSASGYAPQNMEVGAVYYAGLDPASVGADYTVFIILKKTHLENSETYSVEKIYRRKTGTSEQHMSVIADLIQQYNPIATVIEKNSIGALYLERLTSVCKGQVIQGFTTTQQSKALLIGRITLGLEREEILFPSGPIEQELLSFRRNGEKYEAAPKTHDDCVMALGLGLTAADYGTARQKLPWEKNQ